MSEPKTVTFETICTAIAEHIEKRTGERVSPRAIFEGSPTGELWPVIRLYEFCVEDGMPPIEGVPPTQQPG